MRFALSFILALSTLGVACAAPVSSPSSEGESEVSMPKSPEMAEVKASAKKIYFGPTTDICIETCTTQDCASGCIGAFCPGPDHQCF